MENRENPIPEKDRVDLRNTDFESAKQQFEKNVEKLIDNGMFDKNDMEAASQGLFFLKCWESAAEETVSVGQTLGMDDDAAAAAAMFIASQVLADPDFAKLDKPSLVRTILMMGVLTGIEYQERRHA